MSMHSQRESTANPVKVVHDQRIATNCHDMALVQANVKALI